MESSAHTTLASAAPIAIATPKQGEEQDKQSGASSPGVAFGQDVSVISAKQILSLHPAGTSIEMSISIPSHDSSTLVSKKVKLTKTEDGVVEEYEETIKNIKVFTVSEEQKLAGKAMLAGSGLLLENDKKLIKYQSDIEGEGTTQGIGYFLTVKKDTFTDANEVDIEITPYIGLFDFGDIPTRKKKCRPISIATCFLINSAKQSNRAVNVGFQHCVDNSENNHLGNMFLMTKTKSEEIQRINATRLCDFNGGKNRGDFNGGKNRGVVFELNLKAEPMVVQVYSE
ncbi:hypothetical protein M3P05_11150 [Sansalvadorimonas sp. 2012CJ34-2]|uniref:Uncharacterized protein n=1 Tax=Parendozoicomonas callyspongiae TaxID=2942213 RepID=A0ABT0PJ21_9GAMM|nr:hypothetical protein [Sansalvadorimonas sp. 2012CJ34-2]MCL6270478.1 hypothetical protein [Sansalvadorimonas sp. 2012CJ34-2]